MSESITRPATVDDLVEVNTLAELRATAAVHGVDSKGSKKVIAQRLIDSGYTYTVTVETVPASEPEPAEEERGGEPEEPIDEAPKPSTPVGLKAPKVEANEDGSRTVTVRRGMSYYELVDEIDYVGNPVELAALNGVRNGRYELFPGDKVTLPASYVPGA